MKRKGYFELVVQWMANGRCVHLGVVPIEWQETVSSHLMRALFADFVRYNKRFHFIFDKWTGSKWIVSWYKRSFRFLWRKHQGLNWRRKRFSRGLYEVQETYFPDSTKDCYQQFKRYCSLVINFINDQWFKNKFSWKFRNKFNLEYKNRRTEYGWDPPDGMNKWRGIMEHFHLTI